jgi:hypothetical protein
LNVFVASILLLLYWFSWHGKQSPYPFPVDSICPNVQWKVWVVRNNCIGLTINHNLGKTRVCLCRSFKKGYITFPFWEIFINRGLLFLLLAGFLPSCHQPYAYMLLVLMGDF